MEIWHCDIAKIEMVVMKIENVVEICFTFPKQKMLMLKCSGDTPYFVPSSPFLSFFQQ